MNGGLDTVSIIAYNYTMNNNRLPEEENRVRLDDPEAHIMVDGRRQLHLTKAERKALKRRQIIEGAVALYLNLETRRTNQEMAAELGISTKTLKILTKDPMFIELYNENFIELGHDPRLKAIKSGLTDLLPGAFEQLARIIDDPNGVPWNIRKWAIGKIIELNGITPPSDIQASDRKELADFLKERSLSMTQVNINLPPGYNEALTRIEAGDVIEGQFSQVQNDQEQNYPLDNAKDDPDNK